MKKFMIGMLLFVMTCMVYSANHKSQSLVRGTALTLYNGIGDTAVTWDQADSTFPAATNRTYVNNEGITSYPYGTNNTVTGVVNGSYAFPASAWANADGTVTGNAAISVNAESNLEYSTKDITLTFTRSADGSNYDDTLNTFTFVVTTVGDDTETIVITNVPAIFLTGAKSIRLEKIVGEANTTDAGIITINSMSINGYVP